MGQPITDYVQFLKNAREAVVDMVGMKERREQLDQEERQLEKELESEKKALGNLIQQTLKKRSEEITSSYDQELTKGQERLKKARMKREKAKNKGVRERIEEDTEELYKENADLRMQIKTLFRQNRIPAFCNTNLYYTLYFPGRFSQMFHLLILLLLCFLAIPYGSYLLLPVQKPVYLVGIYLVTILAFGGIYILVSNWTKLPNLKGLGQGRLIRDQIYANQKKIRVITKSIRRDRNDEFYNLKKYDDEIVRIETEVTAIGARKREALNDFDHVTKTILADEISQIYQPQIEKLKNALDLIKAEISQLEETLKEKVLTITDQYEVYLGKEFLQIKKLDELIRIMEQKTATNINEAIEYYKKTIES